MLKEDPSEDHILRVYTRHLAARVKHRMTTYTTGRPPFNHHFTIGHPVVKRWHCFTTG